MTTNSVTFNPYNGTVSFRAPFSQDSVFAAQEMLHLLVTYYHHKRITLRINSPGGDASSLAYLLDEVAALRTQGVIVETLGEMTVASAAAILLAYGEMGAREIGNATTLHFHDARFHGTGAQSYADTIQIAGRLSELTRDMITAIATHVEDGVGGWLELANEGQARCEVVRTHFSSRVPASRNTVATARRVSTAIDVMWRQCVQKRSLKPYLDLLNRRFATDTPMEAYEAYSLTLVDRVNGIDAFVPFASRSSPGDSYTSAVRHVASIRA